MVSSFTSACFIMNYYHTVFQLVGWDPCCYSTGCHSGSVILRMGVLLLELSLLWQLWWGKVPERQKEQSLPDVYFHCYFVHLHPRLAVSETLVLYIPYIKVIQNNCYSGKPCR